MYCIQTLKQIVYKLCIYFNKDCCAFGNNFKTKLNRVETFLLQDQARLKLKLDSVQHQKDSDTDKLLATLKIGKFVCI